MTLYTFGGTPADVLTDSAGNVIPDYPVLVKVAGTGATVTALFESDGMTPIDLIRSDPAASATPGRIRTFKALDVSEIEYEYLDAGGQPVRWYQAGREISSGALQTAQQALDAVDSKLDKDDTSAQDVAGPVTFDSPVTFGGNISAPNVPDLPSGGLFMVTGTINGTAADRVKVQAQLDAAHAAGGGTVFLKAGVTYGIDTFLTIYDNTTLWAYGATLKAIGNSGLLRNFLGTETFTAYNGHSHIQVLGGTWDGNASDGSTGSVTGETDIVNFVHCQDILVKDATFLNCSTAHALEFNSTDNGRAINCSFYGFRDNSVGSVRQFSEAIQVDMAKSGSSSIGSFDNTPSKNIRVEGCKFGASDRLGYFGRAVGSHTLTAGVVYDNIKVLDCTVDGALQDGIYAYGWSRTLIRGNTVRNTGLSNIRYAIPDPATTAISPLGVAIRDNHCEAASDDSGIRVTGYAAYKVPLVSIRGNTVKSIAGNAIHAEHCQAPTIAQNNADGTTSTGLYAHYSDGANVSNNTVRNAGSNGINIAGSVGGLVSSNTVDTTSTNFGIFVGQGVDGTNSTDALVIGNTCVAPSSAGIRFSTNAVRCSAVGNKIRKGGGTPSNGISLAASATGCSLLNNDLQGNSWSAAAALSVSTAAPVTGPGGMQSLPGSNLVDTDLSPLPALESAISPSGRYETTSRLRLGTASTPTSGTLYLVPIWLPKGLVISSISFVSGGTAGASLTNQWFTLHDSSRVALARTGNDGSTAWPANTAKTLNIAQTTAGTASSYTTTYAGLHYLGVMIAASTPPNLVGEGSLPASVANASPGFGGANTGQTTPPTVTSGAFTAAAPSGGGILAYGYTS